MCITLIKENEVLIDDQIQWRTNIDNKGGGHIHIFVSTDNKIKGFQQKLMMQHTNT
jgi:hypothetical protein